MIRKGFKYFQQVLSGKWYNFVGRWRRKLIIKNFLKSYFFHLVQTIPSDFTKNLID